MGDWTDEPNEEAGDLTLQATPASPCLHQNFTSKKNEPHLGIYCADCGKWLCWAQQEVTHDPNFVMPYGKHKGQKIKKLPTDYLDFGARTFNSSIRERFRLALEQRYYDFGRALFIIYTDMAKEPDGFAPLQTAVQAFCTKHHIDAGRFHQYLALYPQHAPKHRYWIVSGRGYLKVYEP